MLSKKALKDKARRDAKKQVWAEHRVRLMATEQQAVLDARLLLERRHKADRCATGSDQSADALPLSASAPTRDT